jgi:predicted RNase H-like HicB family nuclease
MESNKSSSNTMVVSAVFEENGHGGYVGYIQEINGVVTEGATLEEAKSNLLDAAKEMIQIKRKLGEHILDKPSLIIQPFEVDVDC